MVHHSECHYFLEFFEVQAACDRKQRRFSISAGYDVHDTMQHWLCLPLYRVKYNFFFFDTYIQMRVFVSNHAVAVRFRAESRIAVHGAPNGFWLQIQYIMKLATTVVLCLAIVASN